MPPDCGSVVACFHANRRVFFYSFITTHMMLGSIVAWLCRKPRNACCLSDQASQLYAKLFGLSFAEIGPHREKLMQKYKRVPDFMEHDVQNV